MILTHAYRPSESSLINSLNKLEATHPDIYEAIWVAAENSHRSLGLTVLDSFTIALASLN